MAQFNEKLSDALIDFIRQQSVFFTATAAADGRINCSPKGLDTLRVLNDHTVAYLDLTGSGAETAAHVLADGRLTIMFCSFGDKPLILRLYGRGEVVRPTDPAWADLIGHFEQSLSQRQVIVLHVESLQTSCGFGVPRMQSPDQRPDLLNWAQKKGEQGLVEYRAKKNVVSIDGLPTGLAVGRNEPAAADDRGPH
jgi:hypothetical protein